uniref:Arylsulfatase D n=1 Tax=Callorhinchus milii TaxID=7868 RepID=A0A4W3H1A5_CALMI
FISFLILSLSCSLPLMLVLHALGLSSVLVTRVMSTDSKSQPNFVVIMADDLGIGDVGCYGNDILRTPNIDRLAQEGVRLTHHIAAAPLCTPSRAAFMTGRYPVRSGMDNSHRVRVILFNAGTGGLPPNETTFAKLLQQEGYSTGIVGKWHLGVNCESREDWCHHPLSHGFGYFYGTPFTNFLDCKPGAGSNLLVDVAAVLSRINQALALGLLSLVALKLFGLASLGWRPIGCLTILCLLFFISWFSVFGYIRLWNCIAMRDFKVVQQPIQLESFPTRNQKKPFLLFVSLLHVHTPLFMTKGFVGNSKNGLYGDNVEEMDWHVGQIVNTIDELGLANRTLIHFTSDHGGSIEEIRERLGDCNGIYKGGKGMAGWEGGIRVPGLFRWPGVLTAGRTIDEPTSLMDIYPTLANLAGAHLPQDRVIDGRDLMPLLEAKVRRSEHEFLFHYCGNELHAVRWHPRASDSVWKAHYFTPVFSPNGSGGCHQSGVCPCWGTQVTRHSPPLLFDLSKDPSEVSPLSSESEPDFQGILAEIGAAVEQHRRTLSSVPQQLSWRNILWRPWLQPCCGTFPFCGCHEESGSEG